MTKLALLSGLLGILIVLGMLESFRHRRNLARIPHRIHVNGTRGKSSVTRLIAAGLRAGGVTTCAKTTGTQAAMILPNGSEFPIYRPARANILEQVRIVDTAAEVGAEVLVIECMALQPLLQSLSELRIVRSTHGVITNVRPDHLDVMGPAAEDVALALAGSIPVRGTLYTAADRNLDVLERGVLDRKSKLVALDAEDIRDISEEDLEGFTHIEHASNVALALRVCADFGVARDVALKGMWNARADLGALAVYELDFFGRTLFFANGLAANDPESTGAIWRKTLEWLPDVGRRIALFNCRVDRPDRSRQLGEACMNWPPADVYIAMGTGTYFFARAATRCGLDVTKLVLAENQPAAEVFETLLEHAGKSALIMGMGNVHGGGEELARLFRNRGTPKDLRTWI